MRSGSLLIPREKPVVADEHGYYLQAQRLNFPLLTDQSDFLRKSFGIKGDMLGLLPGRQTYVIDKSGKVVLSFNDQVSPDGESRSIAVLAPVHITQWLSKMKTV